MTAPTRDIETKAYGIVSIQEQQVLHFPTGLFGFEHRHSYALLDATTPPFYWLQSLEDVDLAFIMVNPYLVTPDYVLDIAEEDLAAVGSPDPSELVVFSIVTIPRDGAAVTCNLQGPVIVNRRERLARQAISLSQNWRIKHPLGVGQGA